MFAAEGKWLINLNVNHFVIREKMVKKYGIIRRQKERNLIYCLLFSPLLQITFLHLHSLIQI